MHLGNGAVTPGCAVFGLGVAAIGAGAAVWMARTGRRPHPGRFAAGAALVFAAQMFNVPVLPAASGHFMGGFLLAYWFGPAWGTLAMALILAVQSLLFADGGLMTLGLNVVNMAIIPCVLVYPWYRRCERKTRPRGGRRSKWIKLAAGSWLSVCIAAAACSAELLSVPAAREQAGHLVLLMLGVHALVGAVEVAVTLAIIGVIEHLANRLAERPSAAQFVQPVRPVRILASLFVIAAVALAATFGASPWPDGLEFSLQQTGLAHLMSQVVEWQPRFSLWPEGGPWWTSLVGCAAVLALAALIACAVRRQVHTTLSIRKSLP